MESRTEEIWIEKHKINLEVSFVYNMNVVRCLMLGFLAVTAYKAASYKISIIYKNEFTVSSQLGKKIFI